MAIVSPEGRWLRVNRRLSQLLGYEAEELSRLTFQQVTHPDDLESDLELVRDLLEGRRDNYLLEKRYLRRDGEPFWGSLHVSLVRREGLPAFFVAQIEDISQRKAQESLLRSHDAIRAAVIETALDAVIIIDAQGLIREWNPAAQEIFGWTRSEALGQPLHDLIVPLELRSGHQNGMARFLTTGQSDILGRRLELPALHRDGRALMVELAVIQIPGVEPPLFTGHLRDITAEKKTLEAQETQAQRLRESEARYTRIAANVPGMVYQFVRHPDGRLEFPFVSEGCREIYGLEAAQIQENAGLILDVVHPDDQSGFRESLWRSQCYLSYWEWEGRICVEGREKWVTGASRPRLESNGAIVWDGLLTDVTERKRIEMELAEAKAEAEEANRAKSEFLSRMSHELRTPLNAILGFGQLLELSPLAPLDAQSAAQIVRAGRHLLELINEVLDIARIESGQMPLSPEAVEIAPLGREVLDLLRPLAQEAEVSLEGEGLTTCDGFVLADRQRFKQILLNLVSNAIKYNRRGGRVWMNCAPAEGRDDLIRLAVHDSGLGFSSEKRSRVFTPFDRLGAENSSVEGTGIGLSLCKHLCEAMRATIELESVEGQGSTFWLCFPRARNPILGVEPTPQNPLFENGNTLWVVLYIEDNFSNLQLVQRLFSSRPAVRLLSAMQGGIGLELARQHRPNLILLDLHLPDLNGQEVLAALQKDPQTRDIPVVILSADASPRQRQRLKDAGATGYLTKPFDVREFLELMDKYAKNA